MPNQVTLTFAGDADKLEKAAKASEAAVAGVGDAALDSGKQMEKAAGSTDGLVDRLGSLGAAVEGGMGAIDGAAGALQAFADIEDSARAQSVKVERALNDVAQAQQDYNQALGDGKQAQADATQAGIDYEQAQVDASVALKDYNAAVKEFGANSDEARQAQVDLKQANADATQAQLDKDQALRDGQQALIDAKGATLDLSDANAEANPGKWQEWSNQVQQYAPLLSGLVGVMGLVAAAQWAWNAATAASPVVWIIAGIVALVAVIVLIATQTNWFQEAWTATWGVVTSVAESAWNFIKQIPGWIGTAFATVADFISAPFKAAFNFVADAWNNTVGQLVWDVPDWVPLIGGSHLGAPKIPRFHTGGTVAGVPGQEVLALLQAGETVTPAGGGGGGGGATEVRFVGQVSDPLAVVIMQLIRTGRIQIAAAA